MKTQLLLLSSLLALSMTTVGCAAETTEDEEETASVSDELRTAGCWVMKDGKPYYGEATIDRSAPGQFMNFKFSGMPGRNMNNAEIVIKTPDKYYSHYWSEDNIPSGRWFRAYLRTDAARLLPVKGTEFQVKLIFDFPGDDKSCKVKLKM